jgi:hypothetical protein
MHGAQVYRCGFHLVSMGLQLTLSAVLLVAAGCSTAPIADFLDLVCPGKFPANAKDARGGVCIPQGGPAGGVLGGPPPGAVPVPPAGPAGPGDLPAPLPPAGPVAPPGFPK